MATNFFKNTLEEASEYATETILDYLLPPPRAINNDYSLSGSSTRDKFRAKLLNNDLDDKYIDIDDPDSPDDPESDLIDRVLSSKIELPNGISWNAFINYALSNKELFKSRSRKKIKLTIKEARDKFAKAFIRNSNQVSFEEEDRFALDIPESELIIFEHSLIKLLKKDERLLDKITHRQFEELILELFDKLGYESYLTAKTRDGGCDLIAFQKDSLGIKTKYVIEAKHYSPPNKVGVNIVRQLSSVKQKHNAHHGLIVTSSFFTADAVKENTEYYGLELNDRNRLFEWVKKC